MGGDARAMELDVRARARVRRALFLVAVLLLGSVAAAQELTGTSLAELRARGQRGAAGTVDGRVYVEARRPDGPDEPLVGASVLIVPRSPERFARLEAARQNARESMRGFREAAPTVRAALEEYELDLWRAGYPDLAIHMATDAQGAFSASVPAGAWSVVVTRSVFLAVDRTPPGAPPRTATALDPLARYATSQYQHFLPSTRVTGFDAVSVWLRDVDVEPGGRVTLALHDRGVWLNGVIEETTVPRRVRFSGGSPR